MNGQSVLLELVPQYTVAVKLVLIRKIAIGHAGDAVVLGDSISRFSSLISNQIPHLLLHPHFSKATTMLPKIPQPDFRSLKDPTTLILVIIGMIIMLGYVWSK